VAVVDALLCTNWPEARHHQIRVFWGERVAMREVGASNSVHRGRGRAARQKLHEQQFFDTNFCSCPEFFLGVGRGGGTG
jgi:hypothetical protein